MKNLIFLALLFIGQNCFAQTGLLPLNDKQQVIYTDSGTPKKAKNEIFKSAQEWISETFGNYQNAVTFEDPQIGKLILTSYVPVSNPNYEYVRFDLTIACTDEHYSAEITQLDGVSTIHSPKRLGAKDNAVILEKEMAVKTEQSKKKRAEAEKELVNARADLESINNAMYKLLAGLKVSLTAEKQQ